MLPRDVYCGTVRARPGQSEALQLAIGTRSGQINLQIDRLARQMADNIPDILVDLLELATYVYCADQFTSRGSTKMGSMGSAWRRRFHFHIPVRKPQIWVRSDIRSALENTLSFLSEDEFKFDFVGMNAAVPLQTYLPFDDPTSQIVAADEIILFSGGLDSLAGTSNALLGDQKRVVLVSHQSSNMIASKQGGLVDDLKTRSEPSKLLHVPVIINKGGEKGVEFTQRTRSFLFATLGLVVARMFGRNNLSFYENGMISINLPISEHVIGARASRTTHPQVMKNCGDLFSLVLGEPFRIENPYLWWTKSDVVRSLENQRCGDLIEKSFSCTRVREATKTRQHCGLCSQCVDRRFGILAAGLEGYDPASSYAFDLLRGQHRPGEDLTLSESYVLRAQKISSMSLQSFASTYGQIFRVIASLPSSAEASARMIWELHQRHAVEVVSVVDRALGTMATTDPNDRSLLSLIRDPIGQLPRYFDSAEIEAPAAEQAAVDNEDYAWRPLLLAIDEARQKAVFEHGIEFGGASYKLLAQLAKQHGVNRGANTHPDLFDFVPANRLADSLGIDPQSLRQRVSRTRTLIESEFHKQLTRTIAFDDVVQNQEWKGYRLNPFVTIVEASSLIRSPAEMSQLAPARVTSRNGAR